MNVADYVAWRFARDLAPGHPPEQDEAWRTCRALAARLSEEQACAFLTMCMDREQARNPEGHCYSWADEVITNDMRQDIAWMKGALNHE